MQVQFIQGRDVGRFFLLDDGARRRQVEGEGGAAPGVVFGPDAAVHLFDQVATDRQAETRAVRAGRVIEDLVDARGVHAGAVVADAGLQADMVADDHGLQAGLHHAVAGEFQGVADQVVEHLDQALAVQHARQFGVALVADHQGHAVLGGARRPQGLNLVHHGAQRRRGRLQLQFAGLGAGQVQGVLQGVEQGPGGIDNGLDVRQGGVVQRLATQQFGHGQDAVHGRAQFAAHQTHELALGAGGGGGLDLGVAEGAYLIGQVPVLLALDVVDGAQQRHRRADAAIGAVAGDDEAAHQGAGAALQDDVGKGVDADAGFDHGRLVVHDVRDFARAVQALAQRTGQLHQEVAAFDQAQGALAVDDGDDQGVRLALETRKDLARHGGGGHRLYALGQHFDRRHTAGTPIWIFTFGENALRKG
ncbi:hypothetical protein D3C86_905090 [compost metagenome]